MIKFDSENSLEMFLYENKEFMEDGLGILAGELARQVDFGCYGRIDLLHCAYIPEDIGPSEITVIELKNEKLKSSHAAQLCRYMDAVSSFINDKFENGDFEVRGVLLGPKTFPDASDNCFLFQSIKDVTCFEFDIDAQGMKFKLVSDWTVSGEMKTKDISSILIGEEE